MSRRSSATFLFGIALAVGACATPSLQLATTSPAPVAAPPHWLLKSTELQYLSCNRGYFRFLGEYGLRGATENSPYAMMASNAYRSADQPYYRLVDWPEPRRFESPSGLAFDVYTRQVDGSVDDIVVAFKGTDFSHVNDWLANLGVRETRQFREAAGYLAELKREHPHSRIVVTGHSLGGALALNMSLRFDSVAAVVFNSSPNFSFRSAGKANSRVHLYEAGQILGPFNNIWTRLAAPNLVPFKYNFLDFKVNTLVPIQEHGMYLLSRGLLVAAIEGGSADARKAFAANIPVDSARAVEWDKCQPLYDR